MHLLFLGPGLLRTVVILVVVYYGSKYLFKWWLRMKVKAAVQQREKTVSQEEASYKSQEKGKVHIKNASNSSSTSSSGGEYIDYEEVD